MNNLRPPKERRKEMSPSQIREREVADFEQKMEEKLKEIFREETKFLEGLDPEDAGQMILNWLDGRGALAKVPFWTRRYADYLKATHADWIEKAVQLRLGHQSRTGGRWGHLGGG